MVFISILQSYNYKTNTGLVMNIRVLFERSLAINPLTNSKGLPSIHMEALPICFNLTYFYPSQNKYTPTKLPWSGVRPFQMRHCTVELLVKNIGIDKYFNFYLSHRIIDSFPRISKRKIRIKYFYQPWSSVLIL